YCRMDQEHPDNCAREDPAAELHLPSPRQQPPPPLPPPPLDPTTFALAMSCTDLSRRLANQFSDEQLQQQHQQRAQAQAYKDDDLESSSVEFDEPNSNHRQQRLQDDFGNNSGSDVSDISKSDHSANGLPTDESLNRLLEKYNLRAGDAAKPLTVGVHNGSSSYDNWRTFSTTGYQGQRVGNGSVVSPQHPQPPPPPPPAQASPAQQKQQISVYDYLSEETKRYLSQAKFNSLEEDFVERSTAQAAAVTAAAATVASSGTTRSPKASYSSPSVQQQQQQQPQYFINKYMENIKTMVSDALTFRPVSSPSTTAAAAAVASDSSTFKPSREKSKDPKQRQLTSGSTRSHNKPSASTAVPDCTAAVDASTYSVRQLDPDVHRWLNSLSLRNPDKYAALFERHEIDMESLLLLNTEGQLRKLGVTAIGPMTKMLHSIRELNSQRNRKRPASAPQQALASARHRPEGVPPLHLHMAKVVERQQKQKQLKQKQQQQQQVAASPQPWIPGGARGRLDAKQQQKQKQQQQQQHHQPASSKPAISAKKPAQSSHPVTSPTSNHHPLINNKQLVSQAERDIAKAAQKVKQKELREKEQLLEERRQHNEWRQRRDDILRHRRPNAPTPSTTPRTPRKDVPAKQAAAVSKSNSNSHSKGSTTEDTSVSAFRSEISEIERKISELLNDNGGSGQAASSGSLSAAAGVSPNMLLDSVETFQKQLRQLQNRVASHRQQQQQQPQHQSQKQQSPPQKEEVRVSQSVTAKAVGFELHSGNGGPAASSSSDAASAAAQRRTSWTVAAGSYKFNEKELIGEGTLTAVHRGRLDGEVVAVKRLKLKLSSDEDRSYLAAEANFLCGLRHPRLSRVLGYCLRGRYPLLFCELAPRRSLSDYLQAGSKVDHALFYCLGQDLADALEFLHSQRPPLLHMRLCSRNVLLDAKLRGQISDLGLSKLRHQAGQLAREAGNASAAWVHLAWMAPELLTAAEFGPPADLYSAGVLLWELLSGRQPYSGQTAYSIITAKKSGATLELPSGCPTILSDLLSRLWGSPDSRPNASDLKSALRSACLPGRAWPDLVRRAGVTEAALRDPGAVRRFLASACRRPCLVDLSTPDDAISASASGSFWLVSEPRLPAEPAEADGGFSAEFLAAVARAARGDE
ncbi:hypothetical protein BOX15_Mlig024048g2, partial [Macrostomum lignano]